MSYIATATDFYLHSTKVEKSELERIFKREFKLKDKQ